MADETGVVSAETAAKLLMMSDRHLRQLVADGWIQKNGDSKYTVVGAVQGYIRYLKDEARRGMGNQAKNRTSDARAREIELRISKQERTLIPIEDAIASIQFAVGAVRAELEGAAASITRDRELRNRIQDTHDGILKRATQRIEREADALRSGNYSAAAVEEDDAGPMGEEEPDLPG